MFGVLSIGALASGLTLYPAFGDQPAGRRAPDARIEAVLDKGLMAELIIACRPGTAIITFSKVERLYCGPGGACRTSLAKAVSNACR